MISLYTIHVIYNVSQSTDFALFYKLQDKGLSEEDIKERVSSIVKNILHTKNFTKKTEEVIMYISGPFTEDIPEIYRLMKEGCPYIHKRDLSFPVKRVIESLMHTIFYDPLKGIYTLKRFEYLDLTPLNMLRKPGYLHLFYLDSKMELHKSYTPESYRKDFLNIYMVPDPHINFVIPTKDGESYLDCMKTTISLIDTSSKIGILIPNNTSLSFIIDLTDVINPEKGRISLFTKCYNKIYQIIRSGDEIIYQSILTTR